MYDINTVFVSFRQLFKLGGYKANILHATDDIPFNIKTTVDVLGKMTGLNLLGYIGRQLLLDALIINEDRHIMNLGVCRKGSLFLEAPCFDNGASLFCVNWTYRKYRTLDDNLKAAESVARPFSKFYRKQVDAVLKLGVKPLEIDSNKLDNLFTNYRNELYPEDIVDRMINVLRLKLIQYKDIAYHLV